SKRYVALWARWRSTYWTSSPRKRPPAFPSRLFSAAPPAPPLAGPLLPQPAARVPPAHTPCYTAPARAPVRSAGCCSSTRGACVHTPGETCPPAGGAGVLRKARSRGGGADRPCGMPLRDGHVSDDV